MVLRGLWSLGPNFPRRPLASRKRNGFETLHSPVCAGLERFYAIALVARKQCMSAGWNISGKAGLGNVGVAGLNLIKQAIEPSGEGAGLCCCLVSKTHPRAGRRSRRTTYRAVKTYSANISALCGTMTLPNGVRLCVVVATNWFVAEGAPWSDGRRPPAARCGP